MRMHPNDIPLTAVSTPFGLFEWMVMPMGLRNVPAIHQWHVTLALHLYIGKICHIYLDDIIIWSNMVEEHCEKVRMILAALHGSQLYLTLWNMFISDWGGLSGPSHFRSWYRSWHEKDRSHCGLAQAMQCERGSTVLWTRTLHCTLFATDHRAHSGSNRTHNWRK